MKNFYHLMLIISLLMAVSCSVTKRHYRPGFHFERKHKTTAYRAENEDAIEVNKELNEQLESNVVQKEDYLKRKAMQQKSKTIHPSQMWH